MNRKLLICVATFAFAATVSAASITWGAGGYASGIEGGGVTGTAYLVQASSPVTQNAIETYLKTNGMSYAGDDFSLMGSYALTESTSFSDVVVQYDAYDASNLGNCFMLIITEGGFILSDIRTMTDMSDVSGESASIMFPVGLGTIVPGTQWVTGTLGTGEVPEPTALALLALGVAGLALRRRAA